MNDEEIEVMMTEMKLCGASDEEVGYAVSKAIYGEDSTELILKVFMHGIEMAERQSPGDQFVAGSRKFCEEQLRKFD